MLWGENLIQSRSKFLRCHVIAGGLPLSSHDSHRHEAKHGLIAAAAHTNNGLFLSTRIKAGTIGRRQAATERKAVARPELSRRRKPRKADRDERGAGGRGR